MRLSLDHKSPVPLYHQLAEALRYRIATGELAAGAVLPPLRQAADRWGVNLHTVRRAYAELAAVGVVVTSVPEGTRVLPARADKPPATDRDQFVRTVVSEAKLRYGLDVDELAALVRAAEQPVVPPAVAVVECSRTQCDDLAGQIGDRWRVKAVPWVLDGAEPPRGLVVATYFHYNDIRLSWPRRLPQVRFLPIAPEAELARRLTNRRVVLCEKDDAMARNIAADLVRILPAKRFQLTTRVVARAEDGLRAAGRGAAILFSPRMWGELSERARRDERVHQVRYVFEPVALDQLAGDQGWEPQ